MGMNRKILRGRITVILVHSFQIKSVGKILLDKCLMMINVGT
jgi:hypothetical protein